MSDTATFTHTLVRLGETYEAVAHTVEQAEIARVDTHRLAQGPNDDRDILTAWLLCERGGSRVKFGMRAFDVLDPATGRRVIRSGVGMAWISHVMRTVSVSSWNGVVGQEIHLLFKLEGSEPRSLHPSGIANIATGERFFPGDLMAEYRAEVDS